MSSRTLRSRINAPVCSIAPTSPLATASCGGNSEDLDRAAIRFVQAEHHVDRRRLARAVRAEQCHRLSRLDGDVDTANGFDRAPRFRQVVQLDAGAYAP
jgi:hypothetical protein